MSLGGRLREVPAALGAVRPQIRDVGSAFSYEVINAISVLLLFPIITRALGPADYGVYTTLYALAALAATWVGHALSAAIVQLLVQKSRLIDSTLRIGTRQVIVLSIPMMAIAFVAAVMLFDRSVVEPAIAILVCSVLLDGLVQLPLSAVFAIRGAPVPMRIRSLGPILRLMGVLILWWADSISILTLGLVNFIPSTVVGLLAVRSLRGLDQYDSRVDTSPTSTREVATYTGLYGATQSANGVQDQGEKVVLAAYSPASEVGLYQAGYRIVGLALIPLRALFLVASRWFFDPNLVRGVQVHRAVRISVPVALYGVACIAGIIVAQPLISLFLGGEFEEAAWVSVWLSGFPLVRGLADVPVLGLLGLGRNAARLWLAAATAIASVGLYLWLVPALGWRGAAIATYVSELFSLFGGWLLLLRLQRSADRQLAGED